MSKPAYTLKDLSAKKSKTYQTKYGKKYYLQGEKIRKQQQELIRQLESEQYSPVTIEYMSKKTV